MKIFSYKSNDSALIKHLKSFKDKDTRMSIEIENPLLVKNNHDMTSKSATRTKVHQENKLSINLGYNSKNSLLFLKNKAKMKYCKRSKKNESNFNQKNQSKQQFFKIKGITLGDYLQEDQTQKRKNSLQIKNFTQSRLQFKKYSLIEKEKQNKKEKQKVSTLNFQIRTDYEDDDHHILKVTKFPMKIGNIRAKSAAPNTNRRKSATFRTTKDFFQRTKTQNIQLDTVDRWHIKDDSEFLFFQHP